MRSAKSTAKPILAYGYARNLFANIAAQQERALLDAGCSGVFVEGRGEETFAHVARKARGAIVKVTTAAVLPNGAQGIGDALAELDLHKAVLVVEDTGKRSDSIQRGEIILDALEGQRRNKHEYNSRTGRKAAGKAAKAREKPRAPIKEVLTLWRDTAGHPDTQALGKLLAAKGWTLRMMYSRFGGRWPEIGFGRPRKSKK